MTPSISRSSAARILAAEHPPIAKLVDAFGMPRFRTPLENNFAALARSIVYQQLAGSAASAIHGRFVALIDGEVTPGAVLAVPFDQLRSVGLSANKALSITDLATKITNGTVVIDSRRIARKSDEEIISDLSLVRGIGRWTAQMFLMFQLRRIDVWPSGDLGVRRGFGLAFGLSMPTERQLTTLGDDFRPYRSIVAWYCWRACELYVKAEKSALTG